LNQLDRDIWQLRAWLDADGKTPWMFVPELEPDCANMLPCRVRVHRNQLKRADERPKFSAFPDAFAVKCPTWQATFMTH
jgi:hypothetical protein